MNPATVFDSSFPREREQSKTSPSGPDPTRLSPTDEMISNPNLIYYACIAHRDTILGEILQEPGIGALAHKCITKAPPHHSLYTHTVRKRTYTFSIAAPFIYFAISDQDLDQSEALSFLSRLRFDFEKLDAVANGGDYVSHEFQAEFDSIVREILDSDLHVPNSPPASRNLSMDSTTTSCGSSSKGGGKRTVLAPLLGLKKKKKRLSEEVNGEMCRDAMIALEKKVDVAGGGDDGAAAQKSCLVPQCERQKAKQVWRRHVWVVLVLDLFVCAVLFGVWLWVCRGFKCIDG